MKKGFEPKELVWITIQGKGKRKDKPSEMGICLNLKNNKQEGQYDVKD